MRVVIKRNCHGTTAQRTRLSFTYSIRHFVTITTVQNLKKSFTVEIAVFVVWFLIFLLCIEFFCQVLMTLLVVHNTETQCMHLFYNLSCRDVLMQTYWRPNFGICLFEQILLYWPSWIVKCDLNALLKMCNRWTRATQHEVTLNKWADQSLLLPSFLPSFS